MFNKSKRVFRGKKTESDSDEETNTSANTSANGQKNSNEIEKPITKNISSSMLSFDHEEEGEVFQIKKPSFSRKYIKQLKKEMEKEKPQDEDNKQTKDNIKSPVNNGTSDEDSCIHILPVQKEENGKDEDDDSDSSNKKSRQHFQDIIQKGVIPDANLIHIARKRRQMAREMTDSFIPLDDTQRYQKTSSRLIRDDDNDASESDTEQGVLALTFKQKETERRKLEEQILAAEEGGDESEHEREWEEQQIKKGTNIPAQIVQPPAPSKGDFLYGSMQSKVFFRGQTKLSAKDQKNLKPQNVSQISSNTSKSDYHFEKLEEKSLIERLADLVEQNHKHTDELDEINTRIEATQIEITDCEEKRNPLELQYKFFQETRSFTQDYVECMNEKMTSINYIERCLLQLLSNRAVKYIKRRQTDIKEQSLENTAGKTNDVIVDSPLTNRNKADREARRARRKRAREVKGTHGHLEGMSTDDELINSEMSKFNTEHERLIEDCKTLFNDVVDDYCQLVSVKSRFEKWKFEYAESYDEAYIGLCLTKLFLPLIKPIIIAFNPLEDSSDDFESKQWFKVLMFYAVANDAREMKMDDPDLKLLPNIIDKILMPHLIGFIEQVWDPLSAKQTTNLTTLLRKLTSEYPNISSANTNTQLLIATVIKRIKKCLDDDIFIPLYPKTILENRMSVSTSFFYRQLNSCVKLFMNINMWNGIVSTEQIQILSVDSLLNRYIMVASTNVPSNAEIISIFQMLCKSIPKDWFSETTNNDCTIPKLENFAKILLNVAKNLQAKKSENRELLKSIGFLLVGLHAINHALIVFTILGCKSIPDK